MSLIKKTAKLISDIVQTRKIQNFDERKVERDIIDPLLKSLGWTPADYETQYSVRSGSKRGIVDYALFRTSRNNRHLGAFIEVKKPGRIKPQDEEQLFGYAVYESPPILILTDGAEWNFYLFGVPGKISDKKFCHLNFSVQSPEEVADVLHKCLHKDAITSDVAIDAAKGMLEAKNIAKAWEWLLQKRDEKLSKLLEDSFRENFGYKPEKSDITKFLESKSPTTAPSSVSPTVKSSATKKPRKASAGKSSSQSPGKTNIKGFRYNGKEFLSASGREMLQGALFSMAKNDKNFLPALQKATKNFISRDKADVETSWHGKSSIREIQVRGEKWYISAHGSNDAYARRIKVSCDVAGISYGKDFQIIYG